MDYTALQVKTSYSILESLNNISELVSKASDLGYTSLSITDNGNLFGILEFYLECKKKNIKPIIGIELVVDNSNILLYAINDLGYKKIIELSMKYNDNKLEKFDLEDNDNLILVMPFYCFNKKIFDMFKYKYVGYSNIEQRSKINGDCKCVFINNVSYLNKDDYKYLDYLYMIKNGENINSHKFMNLKGNHLLSYDEIINFSSKEDILNTKEISDMCNVEFNYNNDLLPVYDKNIDSYEYLSMLCNKGLKKRFNNEVSSIYQERLDYELSVINKMGFCDYFLVVWDYVKYAKFNGILVGPGRGSAAGSLVSYTLGITNVDPIKYDLLFERFLNPERVTMPDIDIDFDNERIDEVIDYVTNKYGNKNVVGIITFSRMTAKQVIRDVGRILNLVPEDDVSTNYVDVVSKLINYDTLTETYEKTPQFRKLINSRDDLKDLFRISLKLEGLIRNHSVHAAGIVISKYELDKVIPLHKDSFGKYLTAFTKDYLEPLGLLKMDFLRLATLSFVDEIINNINENKQIKITFDKIPLDDKKVLKIFYDVNTDGIFQFESVGMKNFLSKLKVSSFDDIVAALALFRPGPMDNIDTYIRRKEGKEKIDYIHPSLEPILKSTYGIIIYQEQIMQIASVMAGYSYGEADVLRRAMSKKDEVKLAKERPKFINGAISKGYDESLANKVFDLILKFANYGFNKSHSVAYAIIAYKMAFLKTYFLQYFLASSLSNVIGNTEKTKTYITEARNSGINILPPIVSKSGYKYVVEGDGIRCPLSLVEYVGEIGCKEVEIAREKGEFTSFINFVSRCYSRILNKNALLSLIKGGCCSEFGYNKKTLVDNLERIINYAELSKGKNIVDIEEPYIIEKEEFDKKELINLEYDTYGFYFANHPTLMYKTTNDIDLVNVSNFFDKKVSVVVFVERIKETITKQNETMAFVFGCDNTNDIDIVLFPKVYKNSSIDKSDVIRVIGNVEKRYDKYQLIAYSIEKLQ